MALHFVADMCLLEVNGKEPSSMMLNQLFKGTMLNFVTLKGNFHTTEHVKEAIACWS